MITLKNTISSFLTPRTLILCVFLTLHVIFFNFNVAEWGDSYRILRAGEYLKKGAYPADEKRPPLFPALLVPNPGVDQVMWGRLVVLVLSFLSFLIFERLCRAILQDTGKVTIALLLYMFNPILFYWSLRIMSDVLFLFLVLAVFWQYLQYRKSERIVHLLAAGFIAGLSVMARFEGYVLLGSLGLGIFMHKPKSVIQAVYFGLAALVLVGPYLYFRNPLTSTYLEEPSSRKYDLVMVWTYAASLLFSLGCVYMPYLLFRSRNFIFTVLRGNFPLTLFLGLELLLVLVWPAAVPRLFIPVLPFLIIFAAPALSDFKLQNVRLTSFVLFCAGLWSIFLISQYYLKLQFLVSFKLHFAILALTQLTLPLLALKSDRLFKYGLVFSSALWAFFVVDAHRLIFISVKNAGEYVAGNLSGNVAYNDVSSVSDWYTNYKSSRTTGFYYNTEKKENLNEAVLARKAIDYLIITNEHNTTMTLDLEKRPYLELLQEFRYNVNGREFFAKVVKLKDY